MTLASGEFVLLVGKRCKHIPAILKMSSLSLMKGMSVQVFAEKLPSPSTNCVLPVCLDISVSYYSSIIVFKSL